MLEFFPYFVSGSVLSFVESLQQDGHLRKKHNHLKANKVQRNKNEKKLLDNFLIFKFFFIK